MENLDIKPSPGSTEEELFKILLSYLPASSRLSAAQAAKEVNSLHPKHRSEGAADESSDKFFWTFWGLMFRVACQIDCMDEAMERFVGLVKALAKLPSTAVKEDGQVWKNLPVMETCEVKFWEGKAKQTKSRKRAAS